MRVALYVFAALLLIAAGFLVMSIHGGPGSLVDLFAALPAAQKAAWAALFAAVTGVLAFALWQSDKVAQQQKAIETLEQKVGLKGLEGQQGDIDQAAAYLARTDPAETMGNLQQRMLDAAHAVALHDARNQESDFDRRVADIRSQQTGLRERLGGVVAKRRAIDQVIAELSRQQTDIERSFEEFNRGDGKSDFRTRVKDLFDSVSETRGRLNEIDRAMVTLEDIKNGFAELQARVERLSAPQTGVKELAQEVRLTSDKLAANVERLEKDNDVTLKERVQKFSEKKQDLEKRLAALGDEFASLEAIRRDVSDLFARLSGALNAHMQP